MKISDIEFWVRCISDELFDLAYWCSAFKPLSEDQAQQLYRAIKQERKRQEQGLKDYTMEAAEYYWEPLSAMHQCLERLSRWFEEGSSGDMLDGQIAILAKTLPFWEIIDDNMASVLNCSGYEDGIKEISTIGLSTSRLIDAFYLNKIIEWAYESLSLENNHLDSIGNKKGRGRCLGSENPNVKDRRTILRQAISHFKTDYQKGTPTPSKLLKCNNLSVQGFMSKYEEKLNSINEDADLVKTIENDLCAILRKPK